MLRLVLAGWRTGDCWLAGELVTLGWLAVYCTVEADALMLALISGKKLVVGWLVVSWLVVKADVGEKVGCWLVGC